MEAVMHSIRPHGIDPIIPSNFYLVTLVTFISGSNILVCIQKMFLICFMITLFTFKQAVWRNNQIMFFIVQKYKL